jgi:hypothetical protein
MKRYIVKGSGDRKCFVEVLNKHRGGYTLMMKQERRWGYKEEIYEMSETLFQTCLRTGYFKEVTADSDALYA